MALGPMGEAFHAPGDILAQLRQLKMLNVGNRQKGDFNSSSAKLNSSASAWNNLHMKDYSGGAEQEREERKRRGKTFEKEEENHCVIIIISSNNHFYC